MASPRRNGPGECTETSSNESSFATCIVTVPVVSGGAIARDEQKGRDGGGESATKGRRARAGGNARGEPRGETSASADEARSVARARRRGERREE